MFVKKPRSMIRPLFRRLHAYFPGEQPKIKGLIKLNTNGNPYPPSPTNAVCAQALLSLSKPCRLG
jgi:histidinol-phosphate/aromatic aminotransferase/cobyric acid decarboxylase-like protein